ncbi:uncharacterized protein [Solanum tuberosum]|uniref:uncharacterized protein n=1 Tax=Solanum tuberosum TaxID=4113 RepID=UPI00073A33A0|nr:PREDICTED: uncharacterized protein LOC107060096 [Solanum tuberosum]
MPTGRLAKWLILLTEFDIVYVTRTAMKAQALADHLAENPIGDEYDPLRTYFPDEEINSIEEEIPDDGHVWKLYFDGAVNKNGVRIGAECHQCQIHSDLIHSPPLELHPMSALWPFVAWGMDVIGPIEPKASNGHRFILVAIDYFTKWVEAVTFKSVTKKAVVDFVHSNIICRFGIPKIIITDNAANLNSHLMKEVCEQFKIVHRHSTPYRPKANRAAEAANKNIKKILRRMVQGSRQWHENYPLLSWDIARLFVVIPAEVEIPSLRIIVESKIEDTKWVKSRLEQLALIDEKWLSSICFGQLYQQRMARAYNKKARPRNFEVGQLVVKCILPHQDEAKGKFAPNSQGPYVIKQVLSKELCNWQIWRERRSTQLSTQIRSKDTTSNTLCYGTLVIDILKMRG